MMRFLILICCLSLLSCSSCTKENGSTDDKDILDRDVITAESDIEKDDNIKPEIEITEPDTSQLDTNDSETTDDDYIPCKVKAVDAGYPYTRDDGSVHFCREGCDTPTENDPDCVTALWKDDNHELCTTYPEYDCCVYPCSIEGLTPTYKGDFPNVVMNECVFVLNAMNPSGWSGGVNTFKHFNLSEGKIGLPLWNVNLPRGITPAVRNKYFEVDLEKRTYRIRMPANSNDVIAYHKGAALTAVHLSGLSPDATIADQYLIYSKSDGVFEPAYPEPYSHNLYEPVMNDKWVYTIMQDTKGATPIRRYAKIGEWKWRSLGEGDAPAAIVGDTMAIYDEELQGYLCDLTTYPESLSECKKINREDDEKIRYPVPDMENEKIIYYGSSKTPNGIVRVDTTVTPWKYEELMFPDEIMEKQMLFTSLSQVRGDLAMVVLVYYPEGAIVNYDHKACYFNVKTKKAYCMEKMPKANGGYTDRYGSPEFEGHWLVWQDSESVVTYARDMECYCDHHPDNCPFDDYTPQPGNPKDVRTGERPNGNK